MSASNGRPDERRVAAATKPMYTPLPEHLELPELELELEPLPLPPPPQLEPHRSPPRPPRLPPLPCLLPPSFLDRSPRASLSPRVPFRGRPRPCRD